MKIKEYFIKKLGGFTSKDMTRATSKAQKSAVKNYKRSKPTLRGKRITPGWLKSEVHRKLDLMFKNDSFSDKARYRWLAQHSLTTSHMSDMSFDELMKVNKILDETIKN